jgi:spermidine synthase
MTFYGLFYGWVTVADYRLIYETQDEFGPIRVLENSDERLLSFGDHDEQSKMLKASPHIPQHTYVQAMLLVLLFSRPRSAIVLGLGGGALLHSLRRFDAAIKLTAVELRSEVITLAKRYFQLPVGKKLNLIHQDANLFLARGDHKKVDVIFADLYGSDGVDAGQLSEVFIARCADLIKADGFLVLNCWKEHSHNRALLGFLQGHFSDIYASLTSSGNWVIFAAKLPNIIPCVAVKSGAQALSQQLDFDLGRSLTRFGPWE